MAEVPKIVLPHGGYRKLIVYRKSEAIYQGTVAFCRRFLPAHGDRTVDQMTQAARSCKQNIAEGSAASGTSKETELKLTNVARATLDELLEDYLDYLKAHGRARRGVGQGDLQPPRRRRLARRTRGARGGDTPRGRPRRSQHPQEKGMAMMARERNQATRDRSDCRRVAWSLQSLSSLPSLLSLLSLPPPLAKGSQP